MDLRGHKHSVCSSMWPEKASDRVLQWPAVGMKSNSKYLEDHGGHQNLSYMPPLFCFCISTLSAVFKEK
jgi:hypothetical protein